MFKPIEIINNNNIKFVFIGRFDQFKKIEAKDLLVKAIIYQSKSKNNIKQAFGNFKDLNRL